MTDFLTFKTFITPSLLIVIYYFGAIVIPVGSWYFSRWIIKRYFSKTHTKTNEIIQTKITTQQRMVIYLLFILCFLCMEIGWRVMFEFFIAYFDMHDALMKLK